MSIGPGTRFGAYEILAAIGEGGMGEVYKARDTRLHREVAVKVVSKLFASDPDRLARFEREATVLASLNHPNVAQIYGVEESNGVSALVIEFVDGPTLADVITEHRGAGVPVARVLSLARQIADALEAAHDQGIVHSDVKPANIKVRSDGTIKVLDFGLAKAAPVASVSRASAPPAGILSSRASHDSGRLSVCSTPGSPTSISRRTANASRSCLRRRSRRRRLA